ncbi:hypothetical protein [Myceligenerans pegani]|uniref:Uncharacterized protein n=1 Tax=Myceligenerans pegani TaxID=2776917 RepID=A0ABR9MXK1_9MICO|nr:hypothetical protein [Myceligenerans sp. TRM 65318]MBE1876117.1 hypothetical protein [Myceligenerans sp. TRM 65318]MBE3018388.1 hypothetical protein [Myceligenerans sp. TRM 65318]
MTMTDRHLNEVASEFDSFMSDHPEHVELVNETRSVLFDLWILVPLNSENFVSGHTFPLTEAHHELDATIMFARLGYYKHAMAAMRNLLELGMLSVYWDADGQSHIDIQEWLRSNGRTPSQRDIKRRLETIPNVAAFTGEHPNYHKDVSTLFGNLSSYVHTRGQRGSSRAFGATNVHSFRPRAVELWISRLRDCARIVTTLHLLRYPVGMRVTDLDAKFGIDPPNGLLHPAMRERMIQYLPESVATSLQRISDADEEATEVADWVASLPDLTPEEQTAQQEKHDKEFILMSGFENWRELWDRALTNTLVEEAAVKERRDYVERLRVWAVSEDALTLDAVLSRKLNDIRRQSSRP